MVPAPPRVLPRSLAPSDVLWGAVRARFPPTWLGVVGVAEESPGGVPSTVAGGIWGQALPLPRLPAHWAGCWGPLSTWCGRGRSAVGALIYPLGLHALWRLRAAGRVGAVRVPGGGLRGAGACAVPPVCAAGGDCRAGGCSASFRPSAFPGQATKRVSLASFCPWGAWPPIPLRFVLARLHWVRSVRRPGALARARLFSAVHVGACGWGGGAGRAPAPLSGGGRGDHPPCLRGWGQGAPRLAGRWGGWGGGGVAPRPPCSPSGSRGRPGVGGDEGRPVDRSPGGPCRPEPPLCPPCVGCGHGGGHGGRGPHTVLVRRRAPPPGLVSALLRRAGAGLPVSRNPRGSRRLGALGRAVCRCSRIPPPRVAVPSRGGAAPPREAGSDPRGHLWVTWGVYLCAGKPPLADIILSHPPDLT